MIEELDELKRQRGVAELFVRACRAVSDFLDKTGPEDRALALTALQIVIRATPTEAVIHDVVPIDPDVYCHTNNHPDARRPASNAAARGVPFRLAVAL